MKKILLSLFLAALPVAVFGQGVVNFANSTTPDTRLTTNNLSGNVGPTTGVSTYLIGLYVGADGNLNPSTYTLAGTATNRTAPFSGLFNGGNPFAIPGAPANTPIQFQVRAWSFSAGATYEQASNAQLGNPNIYLGSSGVGRITPADPTGTIPALFGTGPGQVGGFVLTPGIPEPSSIALGLLGLGAIALFRRRK